MGIFFVHWQGRRRDRRWCPLYPVNKEDSSCNFLDKWLFKTIGRLLRTQTNNTSTTRTAYFSVSGANLRAEILTLKHHAVHIKTRILVL